MNEVPIYFALSICLMLLGMVWFWPLALVGAALAVGFLALWIRGVERK